ncbi:MAG: PAS domain S-box protein [Deltaproteobacteria bacterium]|nr:PAS domain S-box protein [Deltaproteobacteria bacterium]
MTLTRVITGDNGAFQGIIVATLDADYFKTLISSVNYAPDMWASIIHADGVQFLMAPDRPGQAGKNLAGPGSLFSRHRASGRTEEVLTGIAVSRGDNCMAALRTIMPAGLPLDKPLVVVVGRERSAITAQWRQDALVQGGSLCLVLVTSVVALATFHKRQRSYENDVDAAYAQMKESADRLAMATGAAGMGIWEYDLRTQRAVWDAKMYATYGLEPETVASVSDAWREKILPGERATVEAELGAAIRGERPFATTFRIRRSDGEVRIMRAKAQVRHDASGRAVRVVGTNEDITEGARAREQLARRERDLSAILENMPSMVGYWDGQLRNRFGNRAYAAWYGTEPARMAGKYAWEIIGEELYQRNLQHVEGVLRGNPQIFERSLLAPDGTTLLHCLVQYIPDRVDGEVQGFYAFLHDVTPLKNAENALRESEERLRTIFEGAPIPIMILGAEGAVLRVNRAGEAVLGYDKEELRGKSVTEFLHKDDLAGYRALLHRLASGEICRTEPRERRYQRKSGEWLWGRTVASAVRDSEGRFLFAIEMLENMTETKSLQEQLFQAQKMESIGHLAAGLAHDFNNLLMVISASAEIVAGAIGDRPQVKQYLDNIAVAVERAAKLTTKMLDYAGEGPSFREPIDLSRVATAVAGMLRGALPASVRLHLDLASAAPAVVADDKQLQEVAISLITNAWEAIGDRPGEVTVRTGKVLVGRDFFREGYVGEALGQGWYAFLEIADSGCGMDPQTLERIFDPFFTTKFTGRGLELAAVLGIVRSHGGAIRVVSGPNEGSTFTVLLPAEASEARGLDADSAKHGLSYTRRSGAGTVLLVDDEQEVREVTQLILEKLGFEVLTAADGKEGLELFCQRADDVSVVLLDMTMPRMGGKEVLREIQRIRSDTPVVLASGYSKEQASERVLEHPPTAFLQKPFRAIELEETLRGALRGRDGQPFPPVA